MEIAKYERKNCRRKFTLIANKVNELSKDLSSNATEIQAYFLTLEEYYKDLCVAQERVNRLRPEEYDSKENTAKDLDNEWEAEIEYSYRFNKIKNMILEYERNRPALKENSNPELAYQRHFSLPKQELPSFNGEVKQWLTFWSQFKKIHGDPMIDNDDKLQYLTQCMEVGSKARDMVESFPPCGSKYEAVVEQLKQRFATDELVIEHYVRELLQLILSQAKGVTRLPIASLYDKLTTHVLALESMGVTQNKYAAFLYPLVEAALPEEVLRAWYRSRIDGSSESNSLNDLLLFVKREVLADERVHLARTFMANSVAGPSTCCFVAADNKQKLKQIPPRKAPTKACLFSNKTSHPSSECPIAINQTLEERWETIKGKKACGVCLSTGHYWRHCKRSVKCVICAKRYLLIMCRLIHKPGKTDEDQVTYNSVSVNQSTTDDVWRPKSMGIRNKVKVKNKRFRVKENKKYEAKDSGAL